MTADAPADTPSLLILGHVTEDHVQLPAEAPVRKLGGAASFCARVGVRQGERVAVVTSAPPDLDLLETLRGEPRLQVHVVPAPHPTTFQLDYRGARRQLTLVRRAQTLQLEHIPTRWLSCPVKLLGPVADECTPQLAAALDGFVAVGLQGVMRSIDERGVVVPRLPHDWLTAWPACVKLAVFSDEDHPASEQLALQIATFGSVVALTHGARGATLFTHGAGDITRTFIPAVAANEVDPTGAGDTFAVVLTGALARGQSLQQAGAAAAAAAARVVEGTGLGRL